MEYKTVLDKATGELMRVPLNHKQTPVTAPKAFVANMSDDDLRKLTREKLSQALQAIDPVEQPAMTKVLCAEMKDRLDGKAAQSITQTVNSTVAMLVANVQTDDALLARIKRELIEGKVVIDG